MSLEGTARDELLRMRRSSDAVTVGALARTEALRQVMGGGDPRVAYNTLKHVLLANADNLAITAAAYSLGFASNGTTHLDRLNDFGRDYAYDQRQARRYSDRGLTELARLIGSEWVTEASPTLTVTLLRFDMKVVEAIIHTECYSFVAMRDPVVKLSGHGESTVDVALSDMRPEATVLPSGLRSSTLGALASDFTPPATLSVSWVGEVWPRMQTRLAVMHPGLFVQSLGTHLQISATADHTGRARSDT